MVITGVDGAVILYLGTKLVLIGRSHITFRDLVGIVG